MDTSNEKHQANEASDKKWKHTVSTHDRPKIYCLESAEVKVYTSFIIADEAKAGCKKNTGDRCSKDLMS